MERLTADLRRVPKMMLNWLIFRATEMWWPMRTLRPRKQLLADVRFEDRSRDGEIEARPGGKRPQIDLHQVVGDIRQRAGLQRKLADVIGRALQRRARLGALTLGSPAEIVVVGPVDETLRAPADVGFVVRHRIPRRVARPSVGHHLDDVAGGMAGQPAR